MDDADKIDERVRSLLAAGDTAGAATVAIRGHGPAILRYLRSVLGDEDDAREAFSQFAENLWRGLPTFRGTSPFRIWAFRVAWNAACDLRKHPWHRRRTLLPASAASRVAATVISSVEGRLEVRRQQLRELRESLSLDDRALIALRLDQGLSWAECADALTRDGKIVRPNTLTKRFERIKERLGKLARKKGLLEP